jgi:hypothetical protein
MKLLFGLLGLSMVVMGQNAAARPQMRLLAELQKNESTMALAMNDRYIVDATAKDAGSNARIVRVFDAATEKEIWQTTLSHSITYMAAINQNEFMALGRAAEPNWVGYYTRITANNGHFSAQTTKIPNLQMFDAVEASGGRVFFTDLATRGIYSSNLNQYKMLPGEFSGSGSMRFDSSSLWVLARGDLYNYGDEVIARVSLNNFNDRRNLRPTDASSFAVSDFLAMGEASQLFIANPYTSQVALMGKATGQIDQSLGLEFMPTHLADFGSCAAVLGGRDNKLAIVKVGADKSLSLLSVADLNEAGDRLKAPRRIVASAQQRKVVLRSAYPCPTCTVTQSSDFVIDFGRDADVNSCF